MIVTGARAQGGTVSGMTSRLTAVLAVPLELDVQLTEDGHAVVTHDRQVSAGRCREAALALPGDPELPYVGADHPDRLREVLAERGRKLPQSVHPPCTRDCLEA